MKNIWGYKLCVLVILLALCVNEGLCRGGRGGGGGRGSRGGSRSYGRGGGYSGGSYGGGGSAGTTIGIVFGIIGGIITLSVLICLCVICCNRASGANKTSGVVYNTPYSKTTRRTAGVVLKTSPGASGVSSKCNKTKTDTEPRGCPPPYSTIDAPIYNVQNEMKTTQLNGSLQNYGYLPRTEFRTSSTPKVHTSSSKNSHTTSMV